MDTCFALFRPRMVLSYGRTLGVCIALRLDMVGAATYGPYGKERHPLIPKKNSGGGAWLSKAQAHRFHSFALSKTVSFEFLLASCQSTGVEGPKEGCE